MLQKGFVNLMKNEIILFETEDRTITLPVQVTADTVWLNRNQLAELFGRDIKTIGKPIGNALKEELEESEVVAKFATTTRHGAIEGKTLMYGFPGILAAVARADLTVKNALTKLICSSCRRDRQKGKTCLLWKMSVCLSSLSPRKGQQYE